MKVPSPVSSDVKYLTDLSWINISPFSFAWNHFAFQMKQRIHMEERLSDIQRIIWGCPVSIRVCLISCLGMLSQSYWHEDMHSSNLAHICALSAGSQALPGCTCILLLPGRMLSAGAQGLIILVAFWLLGLMCLLSWCSLSKEAPCSAWILSLSPRIWWGIFWTTLRSPISCSLQNTLCFHPQSTTPS